MIDAATAKEFAERIGRDLKLPPGQRAILTELLYRGPSVPCPKAVFCRPGSKSGEVLLGRLRQAIQPRGWAIETCYPNGERLVDGEATRKMKDAADGYALSHATFLSMIDAAEQLPAAEPAQGVGA